MRHREGPPSPVRNPGSLVLVLYLFSIAIPASAQQVGLTINVSEPPNEKITFTTGPAGINRDGGVFVPKDAIVRIANNSGSDVQVTVRFKGNIVHHDTITPMNSSNLVVGSQQLPVGAHYIVSDPPLVLLIEEQTSSAEPDEAEFQLLLPSVLEIPTLASYGLGLLMIVLAVLGWYQSRIRKRTMTE